MDKKGLTLIELVIYAAAFILVTTILTLFIFNLIKTQAKARINKEVLDNSERAIEIMLLEIKHAKNVYFPTSLFGSHPGQLSLETTRNLPAGEKTTYLDFYLDENDRLCLKREGAEPEVLTSENIKITNLVFNHLVAINTQSVRLELSAIYHNPASQVAYQATTTLIVSASLRND